MKIILAFYVEIVPRALNTLRARGIVRASHGADKRYDELNLINMKRSTTAYQLLAQWLAEVKADLVLISKEYRNKNPALSTMATIWALDCHQTSGYCPRRKGWLYLVSVIGHNVFSVCLKLIQTIPDFRRRLDPLEDAVLDAAWRRIQCQGS